MLQPIFEADFSASSYGFQPGRNAHQAVKAARQYVAEGRGFVVDHAARRTLESAAIEHRKRPYIRATHLMKAGLAEVPLAG